MITTIMLTLKRKRKTEVGGYTCRGNTENDSIFYFNRKQSLII